MDIKCKDNDLQSIAANEYVNESYMLASINSYYLLSSLKKKLG